MLSVGLTGNIASGKSRVARLWAAAGIPVLDTDQLAREAVLADSPALEEIRRTFGEGAIQADGTLDRDWMRELVFRDSAARAHLESILHPRIAELRARWLEARRQEGASLVVTEVPLLFEAGLAEAFDLIVLVSASGEERLRRLLEDRAMAPEEARRMMASQGNAEEKVSRADYHIVNDGTIGELEAAAGSLLERLRARSREGSGKLRLDLHLHTRGSWDSRSDPEAVLARALDRGVGRIAITDHDRLGVALEMAARYPELVIAGEEVRTGEGIDLIGLYLTREIPRGTPARAVCEEIRSQGGVAYLPHPYAGRKGGGGRLAETLAPLVDVVEVFNGRLRNPDQNVRAGALAERHGKLRGAGSDAHTVHEVGGSWVELPMHPNTAEGLLAALPGGEIQGTRASWGALLASNWAKLRNRLPGA